MQANARGLGGAMAGGGGMVLRAIEAPVPNILHGASPQLGCDRLLGHCCDVNWVLIKASPLVCLPSKPAQCQEEGRRCRGETKAQRRARCSLFPSPSRV